MGDNGEIKDPHLCRSVGHKGGLRKVGVNPSLGPRPPHPCGGRFTPLPLCIRLYASYALYFKKIKRSYRRIYLRYSTDF